MEEYQARLLVALRSFGAVPSDPRDEVREPSESTGLRRGRRRS
jgi:hypothetical protein